MNAGRALDALVAEKVMGCKVFAVKRYDGEVLRYRCDCAAGTPQAPLHSDDFIDHTIKRYSEDWRVAGEVVERLNAHGWLIGMCYQRPSPPGYYLALTNGNMEPARGEAETLPLAICRAALKAMEALNDAASAAPVPALRAPGV
jgi:hypothetical protein